jgi:hypothetical protein
MYGLATLVEQRPIFQNVLQTLLPDLGLLFAVTPVGGRTTTTHPKQQQQQQPASWSVPQHIPGSCLAWKHLHLAGVLFIHWGALFGHLWCCSDSSMSRRPNSGSPAWQLQQRRVRRHHRNRNNHSNKD